MVIVNIKKEDSKKAFKKEAVFKVPKIKGYPTIRIEKGCDFQRNTNFSYSSQPLTQAQISQRDDFEDGMHLEVALPNDLLETYKAYMH